MYAECIQDVGLAGNGGIFNSRLVRASQLHTSYLATTLCSQYIKGDSSRGLRCLINQSGINNSPGLYVHTLRPTALLLTGSTLYNCPYQSAPDPLRPGHLFGINSKP